MRSVILRRALTVLAVCAVFPWAVSAAGASKTLRVEHGRPIVLVSQKGVLLLEFLKDPKGALVSHKEQDMRHCRARYRYRLFDGPSGAITNGEGILEEIFQVVSRSATGQVVADRGSRTSIDLGEFHLWWSEATAGTRSWIYYRAVSGIRFVVQPQSISFDVVEADQFRRYLASNNVQEFVAAGLAVQVTGPAVFSGDLPDETPVSARIESGRVHDGAFELKLSNLATNKAYIIESSYSLNAGNWNVIHTFTAHEPTCEWSDPIAKDVNMAFYRIREGR
jgi:hypothetical protein